MASHLVIVESPAKAKTINKYLGKDYTVVASFGHVRDLPSKDGSVDVNNKYQMLWEVSSNSKKHLDTIIKLAKEAQVLVLATDPDREGEAIAWHIFDILNSKKLLKHLQVQRVCFNEITKKAILEAMNKPRALDQDLINAYLARRALDYLVGFNLSPILWRKLPGSRSAGRVQSVALKLICSREAEIETFITQEYWSVVFTFSTDRKESFQAKLTHLNGEKLEKFSIKNQEHADQAYSVLSKAQFSVMDVEKKQTKRHPYAPFTTSTIQQEASRKLGFGASRTMRLAQKLYEGVTIGGETVGLITYMRTDGVQLSQEAISQCRLMIEKNYGKPYLPASPRMYKSKAKNAQEAHEAIRPTDLERSPESVAQYLEADELKLYTLIWKRTVASQMESMIADLTTVTLANSSQDHQARASGSVIVFDGFYKVYFEDQDDPKIEGEDEDENGAILPPLSSGQQVSTDKVDPHQHFTQPPPRYSEASLVKKLEELGIGRPSTYASIMQVLQDRGYVRLDRKRFIPEGRGRIVTAFLVNFFSKYVEYDFTANLEESLDDISGGRADWQDVLSQFWKDFSSSVQETQGLRITQVLDALNHDLAIHFFPEQQEGVDPRQCPSCGTGTLNLKLGKFGPFIGCSNYPTCTYTKQLSTDTEQSTNTEAGLQDESGSASASPVLELPKELGQDLTTGLMITLRKGPYGFYLQLGETPPASAPAPKKVKGKKASASSEEEKVKKPKRVPLPKLYRPDQVDLTLALKLFSLPREIGMHPELQKMITASIGMYGPYVKCDKTFKSLGKDDDVLEIGLNRAVVLLAESKSKTSDPGKVVGKTADGKEITYHDGRYGPYIKQGRAIASLPKGQKIEDFSPEMMIELLEKKSKSKKTKTTKSKKA